MNYYIFDKTTPISIRQFTIYRVILGLYLTYHFIEIYPDSVELFSKEGAITNVEFLPSYNKLPIFLFNNDSPTIVKTYVLSLIIAAILFTVDIYNKYYKFACAWLLFGWINLFNRNPFISNPSLAYIGWLLLSFMIVPRPKDNWKYSLPLYHGYWTIVALSYTVSGIHKLQCETWRDGTALEYILNSVLARDNFIVKTLISMPLILKISTYASLFAEISFVFFGLFKKLRKLYWYFFLFFHIGILTTINFTDLTFGMIVSHLFLYDGRWFINTYDKINEFIDDPIETIKPYTKSKLKENDYNDIFSSFTFGILLSGSAMYCINNREVIDRFNELTINSLWGFCIIISAMAILFTFERIFPDVKLAKSPGWWKWVIAINFFQLFSAIIATITWEKWLIDNYVTNTSGFKLKDHISPFVGGILAYVINTWIFYWWHYLRHHVYFLWIVFHQFHHSPKRIETITSFYKHPLEIIVDSQIMAILLYPVLGLSPETSIWLSIFSAFGEYFYHMNLKTPKFIGYFFQRPESHRVHHRQNSRVNCPNYSDFPIWDILNDTFDNPNEMYKPTGFTNETRRLDMLFFKDVLHKTKYKNTIRNVLYYLLIVWGLFASSAFLVKSPLARQANALVSSPLPLVFTKYNNVETYSLDFSINAHTDTDEINMKLNSSIYSNLTGSYNKRNIYGAVFSYGPMFADNKLINLRDQILNYAVCNPGQIITDLGFQNIKNLTITVKSKPIDKIVGSIYIDCKD